MMYPRLALNAVGSLSWPETYGNPPVSASCMLRSQRHSTATSSSFLHGNKGKFELCVSIVTVVLLSQNTHGKQLRRRKVCLGSWFQKI